MIATPNYSGRAPLLTLSAITLVVSFAATASPARAVEPPRISVSYADLNIESTAGLRSLYRRLQTAAQNVCRSADDGRRSPTNFRFEACYKSALDSAVAKVNKPSLTAMHYNGRQATGG